MQSKGKQLKALLEAPEILVSPGVYDGYSVRMASKYGFKSAAISGAGLSESHLGWSDMGIMGYEDNLRFCRALVECSEDLILHADGDTGYGNAVNVHLAEKSTCVTAGITDLSTFSFSIPFACASSPVSERRFSSRTGHTTSM